jgi:hypothetical protein
MEYRILNHDLFTDQLGNKQLFLYIEIQNEGDIWNKAERCNPSDIALVDGDASQIDDVARRFAERCVLLRPKEIEEEEHRKEIELEEVKAEAAINQLSEEVNKLKADVASLKSVSK